MIYARHIRDDGDAGLFKYVKTWGPIYPPETGVFQTDWIELGYLQWISWDDGWPIVKESGWSDSYVDMSKKDLAALLRKFIESGKVIPLPPWEIEHDPFEDMFEALL